jgi:hypothetical protein
MNVIGQLCLLDHGGTCLLTCPKADLTPRDYERIKAAVHQFLDDVHTASRGAGSGGNGKAPKAPAKASVTEGAA